MAHLLTRNPPSVGLEPQTSRILEPILEPTKEPWHIYTLILRITCYMRVATHMLRLLQLVVRVTLGPCWFELVVGSGWMHSRHAVAIRVQAVPAFLNAVLPLTMFSEGTYTPSLATRRVMKLR